MDIEVIDYNSDFPEGRKVQIDSLNITKFYKTPEDSTYITGTRSYVKPDRHPVMIEVDYASDTHIYDGSTYIHNYWSDTSLDEFIETHGSLKYVKYTGEEVGDEPVENRWQILDL